MPKANYKEADASQIHGIADEERDEGAASNPRDDGTRVRTDNGAKERRMRREHTNFGAIVQQGNIPEHGKASIIDCSVKFPQINRERAIMQKVRNRDEKRGNKVHQEWCHAIEPTHLRVKCRMIVQQEIVDQEVKYWMNTIFPLVKMRYKLSDRQIEHIVNGLFSENTFLSAAIL